MARSWRFVAPIVMAALLITLFAGVVITFVGAIILLRRVEQ